jgi:Domain of unknown function (DUF4190)
MLEFLQRLEAIPVEGRMICPHCACDNPEGRKYCRVCAKPLVPGTAPATARVAAAPNSISAPLAAKPTLNKLAVASLVCGFLALLVPFGLAAVVFGHLSRGQIAKSSGRENGSAIAFAGLILGYGQLAIVGVILLGFLGFVQDIRQHINNADPNTRAALLERIAHGDPNAVTPAKSARQQQAAIQALHLIRAKETEYIAEHPDEGYACQMYKVGFDPGGDTELNTLFRESDYDTKFFRCGLVPGVAPGTPLAPPMYLIISVPRSAGNPADAPAFCLDQANGIEQYNDEQWRDAIGAIATSHSDPCPLTGVPID